MSKLFRSDDRQCLVSGQWNLRSVAFDQMSNRVNSKYIDDLINRSRVGDPQTQLLRFNPTLLFRIVMELAYLGSDKLTGVSTTIRGIE